MSKTRKERFNERLEQIGWGLFLIMIGGLALVPDQTVPEGVWLVGTGLIMLGLNAARYLNDIKMSSFTLVLGTVALLVGFSDFVGIELPLFPIMLIIIGAGILVKPMLEGKID